MLTDEDHRLIITGALRLAAAKQQAGAIDWTSPGGQTLLGQCYDAVAQLYTARRPFAIKNVDAAGPARATDLYHAIPDTTISADEGSRAVPVPAELVAGFEDAPTVEADPKRHTGQITWDDIKLDEGESAATVPKPGTSARVVHRR